jgi:hypothetical protein
VQEFYLTRLLESSPNRLRAEAVWHEDVANPGDASLVELTLVREGEAVRSSSPISRTRTKRSSPSASKD